MFIKIIIRTIFFYFFIILVFRIMGKREIGELSIQDFVVSMLIAEIGAISIEKFNDSIFLTLIPIIILCVLEVFMGKLFLKTNNVKKIIDGKPVLIINKGKINYKEMIKQRYSLDDLLLELRNREIKNINDIEYAILENNGNLNIFKYENLKDNFYPFPLVVDGVIQYDTLDNINKSDEWLIKYLNKREIFLDEIFYAFYKDNKIYIISHDDLVK
ncbi:MAG: DUF421 domain-containing protein [Bacilli bacterium]|nr:DUF421 domain-containing protein [Bacilli bacterium]